MRLFLAALALVAASVLVSSRVAAQCGVIKFSNGSSADLTAYSGATPATGVALTQGPPPYTGTYTWLISPCVKICNGNGYLAQESTSGSPNLCGTVLKMSSAPAPDVKTGKFIIGKYSGSNPADGYTWDATVQMFCATNIPGIAIATDYSVTVMDTTVTALFNSWSASFCAAPPPTPAPGPVGPPGTSTTVAPGTSPTVAPGPTPAPDTGNNNEEGCCTWGAVFLMCFFIPLGVYFFGFLAWNYKNGLRGTEMLPHLQFWASLPGLFADGIRFTWCKIRSQPFEPSAARSAYSAEPNAMGTGSYTTV